MIEISSFGGLQGRASQHHAETAAEERVYFLMCRVVALNMSSIINVKTNFSAYIGIIVRCVSA